MNIRQPAAPTAVQRDALVAAVAAASRAPSMHNTQPWRFRLHADSIHFYADPARQLPIADPSGWAVKIAIGAAVANAQLSLTAAGWESRLSFGQQMSADGPLARLDVVGTTVAAPADLVLARAIPRRVSNRLPFAAPSVEARERVRLTAEAQRHSARLEIMSGRGPVAVVAELVAAAEVVLRQRPGYAEELASWSGPGRTVDGIVDGAAGVQPAAQDLLAMRDFGGPPRSDGRDFETDPLVGILGTIGDTDVDQLRAGYALQHVLLAATDSGLAVSMLSQPIEVPAAREQLMISIRRRCTPQMVLRIGYGQPVPASPRRPVQDVLLD